MAQSVKEAKIEKVVKMFDYFVEYCAIEKKAQENHAEEIVKFFFTNIEQVEKAYDIAMEGKVA